MKKSVLVLLLLLCSLPVRAVDPFTISDIRVEGLERLDAGTVFNYLPLKVGDEMNDEEGRLGIRALFEPSVQHLKKFPSALIHALELRNVKRLLTDVA